MCDGIEPAGSSVDALSGNISRFLSGFLFQDLQDSLESQDLWDRLGEPECCGGVIGSIHIHLAARHIAFTCSPV